MPRRPIVRKHVASPAPAAPKAEQAPQISVTRGAGVLKFDPERPQGSFLVLSDSGTVLGRGFYGAGRLYVHFQEPETRKPGEWIFADAKQAGTNMMVLSSPLLGNEPAVMSIIGEAFPDREIVGIDCRAVIQQHGSLHCCTMQYY